MSNSAALAFSERIDGVSLGRGPHVRLERFTVGYVDAHGKHVHYELSDGDIFEQANRPVRGGGSSIRISISGLALPRAREPNKAACITPWARKLCSLSRSFAMISSGLGFAPSIP